ncbi:MAG: hypothetical protein ABJC04_03310 [Verrucomicrobiota bacterium]
MKTALEQIVNTVLYEGYILYPYRASSQKNQRERFTFGRVYPKIYSEHEKGAEPCVMQAEVLLQARGWVAPASGGCENTSSPKLKITVGFLQPMRREIGKCAAESHSAALSPSPKQTEPPFQIVPQLEVDGKIFQTWTEAVERKVSIEWENFPHPTEVPFAFATSRNAEPITNVKGIVEGTILRRQEALDGLMEITAESLAENLCKISVRVSNHSPVDAADLEISENVLQRTFVSTHVVFEVEEGEFVSLLETPLEFKSFADDCKNIGVWPVLVGDEAKRARDTMLASPIILYDYPQIAPESAGDFFDGTEMDEMLTLRVLTMTDDEKREMGVDDFSRRILERTHALDAESFLKLHGGMREVNAPAAEVFSAEEFFNPAKPVKSVSIQGSEVKVGDRVLIQPKRRADAMDLMLAGKIAIIEAVEQDAENKIHFALVLEDDPGRDMGFARQSGHRFFYGADEVEPLPAEVDA